MKMEYIFCAIIWLLFSTWQILYIDVVSRETAFLTLLLYLGIEFILISLGGKKKNG